MRRWMFILLLAGFFLIFSYSGLVVTGQDTDEEFPQYCDENNTFFREVCSEDDICGYTLQFCEGSGCDSGFGCCGTLSSGDDGYCCRADYSDDPPCQEGLICENEFCVEDFLVGDGIGNLGGGVPSPPALPN